MTHVFELVLEAVRQSEPRGIVLENVRGILRTPVPNIIQSRLQDMGYNTSIVTLDSVDFGVPQVRKRVYFVATYGMGPPEVPLTNGASRTTLQCVLE